jgi:hypothetical protein
MDQFCPEICCCLMCGKIKPILHGFQVQSISFPDCLTIHALEFYTKIYGCFNFVSVCVFYKSFIWVSIILFWYFLDLKGCFKYIMMF